MDKNPILTSMSMKQRHFMDKLPIRTSTSMKERHFMDKNPFRTSTLREAHFFVSRDFERLRGELNMMPMQAMSSNAAG